MGAILMEQTGEWTVQRGRYMTLETLAPVCEDVKDLCIIPDSRRFPDLASFARDFWSGGMDLFLREASARIGGRSGRS